MAVLRSRAVQCGGCGRQSIPCTSCGEAMARSQLSNEERVRWSSASRERTDVAHTHSRLRAEQKCVKCAGMVKDWQAADTESPALLTEPVVRWCSWCIERCEHKLQGTGTISRNVRGRTCARRDRLAVRSCSRISIPPLARCTLAPHVTIARSSASGSRARTAWPEEASGMQSLPRVGTRERTLVVLTLTRAIAAGTTLSAPAAAARPRSSPASKAGKASKSVAIQCSRSIATSNAHSPSWYVSLSLSLSLSLSRSLTRILNFVPIWTLSRSIGNLSIEITPSNKVSFGRSCCWSRCIRCFATKSLGSSVGRSSHSVCRRGREL